MRRAVSGILALGVSLAVHGARAQDPGGSSALVPPEPPPPPPPPGVEKKPSKPSAAEQPPPDVPFDAFLATPDDPRIPNFLRALRLGKDSLLIGAYLQPGFWRERLMKRYGYPTG